MIHAPLDFPVKRLTLSFLCIMVAICKVFRLLWSHIVVTAAHSSWQLSLLSPFLFSSKDVFLHITSTKKLQWCAEAICVFEFCAVSDSFMWNVLFICSSLVPTGGVILWCTRSYFRPHSGTTRPLCRGFGRPFWQPPCWLPTEVSGWASASIDKPSSLPGHDGKAHGSSVGRQADSFPYPPLSLQLFTRRRSHPSRNFTPYWQCGFCQLPLRHSSCPPSLPCFPLCLHPYLF